MVVVAVLPRSIRVAVIVISFPMLLRVRKFAKVVVEALEALFPVASVLADPVGDVAQWLRLEAAGPPLGLAPLLDQSGTLENLEVLRDGRQAEVEGSGQLRDCGLARGEPREDGPPCWIRQGRKGGTEEIRLGQHFAYRLFNPQG